MPIRIPRIVGAVLTAGLLVATAAPALAEDGTGDPPVEETHGLKERCHDAIERRLTDLATAQSRIAVVDALTETHASTLNGIIDSTESGLADHAIELEAEDNRLEIVRLCAEIATDFRVYLVVLPQTHLTVAADRVELASARSDELIASFDEAVAAAIEAGADVADAVIYRDKAVAHLDAAEAAVAGVADDVLTVTPSSYNAGPGETVISDTRAAVRSAHTEIGEGVEDAHTALQKLREALDAVGED